MKIKNLLFLLLALPLAFAACTETPDEVKKEAQLTLTSADTLEFKAEGGTAEISYALVNPVEGTELTATCEAEWVQVVAGDKVRVTVEANNGEARQSKITVAYGNLSFDVAVKQEAKPAKEYLYDVEMVYAERYDLEEYGLPDNYFLIAFYPADGNILLGTVLLGAEGESILSAGTYTAANGGLLMEGSSSTWARLRSTSSRVATVQSLLVATSMATHSILSLQMRRVRTSTSHTRVLLRL